MLRMRGLSVIGASDGNEALDALRLQKGAIDLLILDITLSGATSREVYEEARRLRPDLPLIVTSAKSEEMAAASLNRGIEHFLRQPWSCGSDRQGPASLILLNKSLDLEITGRMVAMDWLARAASIIDGLQGSLQLGVMCRFRAAISFNHPGWSASGRPFGLTQD